jgi:hypothetical protein
MWAVVLGLVMVIFILIMKKTSKFSNDAQIPKIIWTYWDTENPPEIVQKSLDNWRKYSPDWTINMVTPNNIKEFLPDVDFEKFRPKDFIQRKVDLIRLYLISKYGGVWSDATIAVKRSHDWLVEEAAIGGYEFIGYYRESSTDNKDYPVIENWLFGAVPNSDFVTKWRIEYEKTGNYKAIEKYIEDVEKSGVDIQNIPDPGYLTPYVSAQVVMQKQMTLQEIKNKIKVIKSDDGPFKHSTMSGWDPAKSMKWLCDQPNDELPDVIKVYGNERRAVEADESLKCSYKIFE